MSIMKINGSVVNGLTLSGQNVVRILRDDEVLWEKTSIDYFYLENETEYLGTFTCTRNGSPAAPNLEYSTDGVNWTTADMSATWSTQVPARGKLYLRGDNGTRGFNRSTSSYYKFSMNANHSLHGNIMSIQNYNTMDTVDKAPDYCFTRLFYSDKTLINVIDMNFGNVTVLGVGCCGFMFASCSALTAGPDLSRLINIGDEGCGSMFSYCSALRYGTDITNVISLGTNACNYMYLNCSQLQTVYAPNITFGNNTISWVGGAGSSAETPKIMYFKTQELMDSCPSGNSGYGNYVKTLIPKPTPTVYELKINNELDGITYDVDGGNEIFLPNTYGDLGVIEVSGTASTITFHDAEPSKLRIIEFSSTTTGGRVDGYAIDLATFDTTRQIHIYEH